MSDTDAVQRSDRESPVFQRLVKAGPKVCFCCEYCVRRALLVLSRSGIEMRLIDGPDV